VSIGALDTVVADDGISIGYDANTTGNLGISIGSGARADSLNAIAIGYQASVANRNEVSIGNSSTKIIGGYVNWAATSDGRVKQNVHENVPGLELIDRLRPVTYQYDVEAIEALHGRQIPDALKEAAAEKSNTTYTGFIAQEVAKTAKELNFDFSGVQIPDHEEEMYALRYAEFVVPLVKATQELHELVRVQQEMLVSQLNMLEGYRQQVDTLSARVELLEMGEAPYSVYSGN
jgi:hypothetical protein